MALADIARGGLADTRVSISVAGLTTLALTGLQTLNRTQNYTGALTGNCVVTELVASGDAGLSWVITNNTTGAFTLSIAGPSGATYSIPQGKQTRVLWDGTNMGAAEIGPVRPDVAIVSGITGASPAVTLTAAQAQQTIISLQGNATGTPAITVPSAVALYVINTQLASATNVSVGTATGTPATLNKQGNAFLFVDSANNAQIVASTSS
jgi:hypothetical protein